MLMVCLFAFINYTDAQSVTAGAGDAYTYHFTRSTYDTLSNADSVIFVIPDKYIGATFPKGAILDYTVYTKAVSGTTTALVAYPEYSNSPTTEGKWFRDYSSLDSLQIVASTFSQNIGAITGIPCYARHARMVVKQTGTAVRIVDLAFTVRQRL